MFRHFVRVKCGVRAAHQHRDSPAPEFLGDLISAQRRDRPDGNRHHVDIGIEVDLLGRVIDECYLPLFRRERGQIRHHCTHQLSLPQFVGFEQAAKAIAGGLGDKEFRHNQNFNLSRWAEPESVPRITCCWVR